MIVGRRRFAPLALLLCSAASSGSARSAEPLDVRVFLRPANEIREADPFELVIRIDGATSSRITPPEFSGTRDLRLLAGPNTKQRMSFSQGRTSQSYEIAYQLVAPRAGTFEIPALAFTIDDRIHRTPVLSVVIGAAGAARAPGATAPGGGGAADPVVLELEVGPREVWVGQPVSIAVTLLTTQPVTGLSWVARPSFDAFWVETVDVDPERDAERRRIDGRTYTSYPLERRVLVPQTAGEFAIEPYVLQLQARVDGGFGLLGFGRVENLVRKTAPARIAVKALPAGPPEGFAGAVGRFSLAARLDRRRAAVNDAVALRVTVEGPGSLHAAAAPRFVPPQDVKVFEPKVVETTTRPGDGLRSRRSWEWILVPLRPGELELPEIRFAYFDPAAARYEVARAGSLDLTVERGQDAGGETAARGEIRVEGRDLAYLKPLAGRLSRARPAAHRTSLFRVLLVLPVALVPLGIVAGRRYARLWQDRGLVRSRRAASLARHRLRALRRRIAAADAPTYHEALGRALVEYVADRFDRGAAGLTYDVADELLASRGVDATVRRRFRACLEACDFARFVPAAAKSERRTELLEEAVRLVDALERAC